jgi:hypothetical protein
MTAPMWVSEGDTSYARSTERDTSWLGEVKSQVRTAISEHFSVRLGPLIFRHHAHLAKLAMCAID